MAVNKIHIRRRRSTAIEVQVPVVDGQSQSKKQNKFKRISNNDNDDNTNKRYFALLQTCWLRRWTANKSKSMIVNTSDNK